MMLGCIFCDIVSGKIPSKKIFENEKVIAFDDINPQAPVHVIMIPKKHISNIMASRDQDRVDISAMFRAVGDIARKKKVDGSGFRLVINNGKDSGQAVDHLHFHIIGGRVMEWPPG